jgi:uncharacterized protein (DUF2141 family)
MLTLLLGLPSVAGAADLVVTVKGVGASSGNVLVALCTPETFLKAGCPYSEALPARAGTTKVVLSDVPPGTYAVQAFHDANANQDLDRTLFGFPKEGLGFGNDAPMRFGPPRFADAAVRLAEPGGATSLTLRYFR